MKGDVARKGSRWYAVIYEGLDPITGPGTSRLQACRPMLQRLLSATVFGD